MALRVSKNVKSLLVIFSFIVSMVLFYESFKSKRRGPTSGWVNEDQQNPSNLFGMSAREIRLADRVRDVEDQNRMLRKQLSFSQRKLDEVNRKRTPRPSSAEDKDAGDVFNDESRGDNGSDNGHQGVRNCDEPVEVCDVLDISFVCAGYNSSRTVVTMIKSILFFRKHPIHFHFLTSNTSKRILKTLFDTWMLSQVRVSFYNLEEVVESVSWIPNKHYSGVYGLLKLTLPAILPGNLTKTIVLDTDMTLATDISRLWKIFEKMKPSKAALGLVENQSDWYLPGKLWKGHSPWPALGRGFNSGVILMDLQSLRSKWQWDKLWRQVAEKELITMYTTTLADQDIINAVIKASPTIVYKLPCQWNLQLSDNTRSEICYSKGVKDLNLIHFNSPKKLNVKNKHAEYFRNQFLTFLQYDGNLLRRDLLTCGPQNTQTKEVEDLDELCYDLKQLSKTVYRTHLYYMDYRYDKKTIDITLAAQLSMDRLHMIEELCLHWEGPMSLSLYLSDSEADQFVNFALNSDVLKARSNVGYHIVYKEGSYYPINYLRNIALENINTDFVFLSDIDFLPGLNSYSLFLKQSLNFYPRSNTPDKFALVVPAFETQRYRLEEFPTTKADALNLLDIGTLLTFRYHVWTKGHRATDYARWRTATTPYKIHWELDYEPYVILPTKLAPKFDNRFVGFGWNKVSYTIELAALDFEFWVLPNIFIVHMPHAPSLDIAKYRSSKIYRKCLKQIKQDFVNDIKKKYGKSITIKAFS